MFAGCPRARDLDLVTAQQWWDVVMAVWAVLITVLLVMVVMWIGRLYTPPSSCPVDPAPNE